MSNQSELIPHLFRIEYRKIVAVLCSKFSFEYVELAEDIASETFLAASELWGQKGIPENPTAWLYTVAKNKAKNQLLRNTNFQKKIKVQLDQDSLKEDIYELDMSDKNIEDSQLKMMFLIADSSIGVEAQIGLALRILCGFGITEIADSFLTNKETINKRLNRAKEKLREINFSLEIPNEKEIKTRLDTVLIIIYLLFNQGYYSSTQDLEVKKDFCLEAIRLCYLLLNNPLTNQPKTNALMSLICFHTSRFDARHQSNGQIILFEDQDINLWNQELILKGEYFLNQSATGNKLSKYHLEAAIAYWHTQKNNEIEKWNQILNLYNQLLILEYSPIAALNRAYAISKAESIEKAIQEALKLKLESNHFYFILLGELYKSKDAHLAIQYFEKAFNLTNSSSEKEVIKKKIDLLR